MKNITDKEREYIKKWAYDDYDCGKIMDSDDFHEFAALCREDGIKPSKELFNLYYEYVDEARDEEYYKNKWEE